MNELITLTKMRIGNEFKINHLKKVVDKLSKKAVDLNLKVKSLKGDSEYKERLKQMYIETKQEYKLKQKAIEVKELRVERLKKLIDDKATKKGLMNETYSILTYGKSKKEVSEIKVNGTRLDLQNTLWLQRILKENKLDSNFNKIN